MPPDINMGYIAPDRQKVMTRMKSHLDLVIAALLCGILRDSFPLPRLHRVFGGLRQKICVGALAPQ
jgi:hypothetical protein